MSLLGRRTQHAPPQHTVRLVSSLPASPTLEGDKKNAAHDIYKSARTPNTCSTLCSVKRQQLCASPDVRERVLVAP